MMICTSAPDDDPRCDRCNRSISEAAYAAGYGYCPECFRARRIPPRSRRVSQPDPSPWQENAYRAYEDGRAGDMP
jgi:hypothetical protein